jgi:hypothetical protein
MAGLLGVASLSFAWQAVVDSSASAMKNALLDCAIAAVAAYLYRRDVDTAHKP